MKAEGGGFVGWDKAAADAGPPWGDVDNVGDADYPVGLRELSLAGPTLRIGPTLHIGPTLFDGDEADAAEVEEGALDGAAAADDEFTAAFG